jgi:hypothetical protein
MAGMPGLDQSKPIDLLATAAGVELVEDIFFDWNAAPMREAEQNIRRCPSSIRVGL